MTQDHQASFERVRSIFLREVEAAGWTVYKDGLMKGCITKEFDTTVGKKSASLMCHLSSSTVILSGDYQSEGRNVLAADSALVAVDLPDDDVSGIVAALLLRVQRSIDQSFARRLFLTIGLGSA